MEMKNIDNHGSTSPSAQTVAIAINGSRKSQSVIQWALTKFMSEGIMKYKLLHVRPRITTVPTLRSYVPIAKVRDDVAAAYKMEVEWQTNEMLIPYRNMFVQKQVEVDVVVVQSDNIAKALSEEVSKSDINILVIGSTSQGIFNRKPKKQNLSSRISESAQSFCTVYVVSKGKLSSVLPSNNYTKESNIKDDSSDSSTISSSSYTSSSATDLGSVPSYSHFASSSLSMQRFQALSNINKNLDHTRTSSIDTTTHSRSKSLDLAEANDAISSPGRTISRSSSYKNESMDNYDWSDPTSKSDECQVNVNFELEKLRTELRHVRGMYAVAEKEGIDASRKLNDLNELRLEKSMKLKELNCMAEEVVESTNQEQQKYEAAVREAECIKACAEKEASLREEAEMSAERDAKEHQKLENALGGRLQQFHMLTWEEIVSATSSFSENLKIGSGACGTVYKCSLHHMTVAIKVLKSNESQRDKQFQQELEILSKFHHPHLLLLLGTCPDRGCLVYEYMENGSLEDRLFRKDNTPPIPWFERYRIAWEVASALVFLHTTKPDPIIHRDLKPANILLGRNLVSKIGDVGLSKIVYSDPSPYYETGLVGTVCYIDPEYQRTGFISPKSDVYAFGMVMLQLLTAKPAMALAHMVETAVDEGNLENILDSRGGNWPVEETKELAMLGLRCAELRRKDRPDLKDEVLPALWKLKVVAERARDLDSSVQHSPPNHFICPILKDVMRDPCVAADGYTYDRKAIEEWLEKNDNSPMTNLPLPNKNMLPNYNLLSAITEWKSGKHQYLPLQS